MLYKIQSNNITKMSKKIGKQKQQDANYKPYERIYKKQKAFPLPEYCNRRYWLNQQQKLYVQFLMGNHQLFNSKQNRIDSKVFKKMEICIKTRTSVQCRSHHQKMQKKYGLIDSIVQGVLQDKICNENYKDSENEQGDQKIKLQPEIKVQFAEENIYENQPIIKLQDSGTQAMKCQEIQHSINSFVCKKYQETEIQVKIQDQS